MSRRYWLLIAVAALAIAAAGIIAIRRVPKRQPPPTASAAPAVFDGPEATITGHAEPHTTITVSAPIDGILESYFVDLNQEVYKDQLLGRIRNMRLEAAGQQAQQDLDKIQARLTGLETDAITARMEASRASADQARAHGERDRLEKIFQRQQMLFQEGVTPRLTFEKSEKDYSAAKGQCETLDSVAKLADEHVTAVAQDIEAAKRAVGEYTDALERAKAVAAATELRSPADGVVIARKVQPGEPVDPSMTDLFQIATALTSMQVLLTPEPRILARIHAGQTAAVRLPDLSSEELSGTVREVSGPQVIVDFTSPTPIVKLGLLAQVRIKF